MKFLSKFLLLSIFCVNHLSFSFNVDCELEDETLCYGFGLDKQIESYIKRGKDVNAIVYGINDTPLMAAAYFDKPESLVKLLAVKKIDLEVKSMFIGQTALIKCVAGDYHFKKEQTRMLNALISAGANINAQDKCGSSPLHYCISFRYYEAFDILLGSKGININIQDKSGNTPLMNSCYFCFHISHSNYCDFFEKLIKAGADVNVKNLKNQNALIILARSLNHLMTGEVYKADYDLIYKMFETLIDNSCDVEVKDKDGKTFLDYIEASNFKDRLAALVTCRKLMTDSSMPTLSQSDEAQRKLTIIPSYNDDESVKKNLDEISKQKYTFKVVAENVDNHKNNYTHERISDDHTEDITVTIPTRTSSMREYYANLYKNIKKEDLQHEGQFIYIV